MFFTHLQDREKLQGIYAIWMDNALAMLLACGHITLESTRVASVTIALLEYEWEVENGGEKSGDWVRMKGVFETTPVNIVIEHSINSNVGVFFSVRYDYNLWATYFIHQ